MLSRFQFHFGSIGRRRVPLQLASLTLFQFHFGSIGSEALQNNTSLLKGFQFHFGSIGRPLTAKPSGYSFAFQFHFGSIGSYSLPNSTAQQTRVSIPLWFDWKSKKPFGEGWVKLVSIPLWFDWKLPNAKGQTCYLIQFQFHFGSIGSCRMFV